MRKPAREQWRNTQVPDHALPDGQASASRELREEQAKMERFFANWLLCGLVLTGSLAAQKANPAAVSKRPTAVFAVIDSGKYIEPIGKIEKGKLAQFGEAPNFGRIFYAPNTTYTLVFAGGPDGKVTVAKSLIGTECAGNTAEVSVASTKAKLKGFVMGLGTNAVVKSKAPGVRRLPTAAERAEIESLVRAEFKKQGVSDAVVKKLDYHNLTAIDVDRDGTPELVGTFWVAPTEKNRNLLFFIAEKRVGGAYAFSVSNYEAFTPDDIMSGDAKDLDNGILHELLLDSLDVDGDGIDEIFTTTQAFEGRNFDVYRRAGGKWRKVFESRNFRCGY